MLLAVQTNSNIFLLPQQLPYWSSDGTTRSVARGPCIPTHVSCTDRHVGAKREWTAGDIALHSTGSNHLQTPFLRSAEEWYVSFK